MNLQMRLASLTKLPEPVIFTPCPRREREFSFEERGEERRGKIT